MKEIKAFIRPKKVENVVTALKEKGYSSVSLTACEGTGGYSNPEEFPSLRFKITDSEIVKLEIVCKGENVDEILQIIHENGKTPERGDGIIYISEAEHIVKVKDLTPG